jgi:hypothetical protein
MSFQAQTIIITPKSQPGATNEIKYDSFPFGKKQLFLAWRL